MVNVIVSHVLDLITNTQQAQALTASSHHLQAMTMAMIMMAIMVLLVNHIHAFNLGRTPQLKNGKSVRHKAICSSESSCKHSLLWQMYR